MLPRAGARLVWGGPRYAEDTGVSVSPRARRRTDRVFPGCSATLGQAGLACPAVPGAAGPRAGAGAPAGRGGGGLRVVGSQPAPGAPQAARLWRVGTWGDGAERSVPRLDRGPAAAPGVAADAEPCRSPGWASGEGSPGATWSLPYACVLEPV